MKDRSAQSQVLGALFARGSLNKVGPLAGRKPALPDHAVEFEGSLAREQIIGLPLIQQERLDLTANRQVAHIVHQGAQFRQGSAAK